MTFGGMRHRDDDRAVIQCDGAAALCRHVTITLIERWRVTLPLHPEPAANTRGFITMLRSKSNSLEKFRRCGVVPVVRVALSSEALCAVEGIIGAGIASVEITLTIPRALSIIERISDRYGDKILVGAGTVLDAETCRAALLAGAEFIVSPAFDRRVVEMTLRYGKISIPGALTPTEVLTAWEAGADLVKVFHCGLAGGPRYLRALKGPFPQIDFLPTGGIQLDTAPEYIRAGAAALGVGEGILDAAALQTGDIERIASNGRKYVEVIESARKAAGEA
jgi:2-dehydro-3-deoxyphosphogluconate aldolase/(4S)-4-hydroxy-2-oxoglutarate aldolase